ncbi:MAG TPA: hypothetical protein VGG29_18130 [Caulobacteraceae bacterium]|jgi:hypothetical protein
MALFFRGRDKAPKGDPQADARLAAWEQALATHTLPPAVTQRLADAGERKIPWMATMTPAELLLARTHGLRPLATVTGTCWFQFGRSWTEGHAAGWRTALERLSLEAVACGASAVVDVKMRTTRTDLGSSMDYTLIGTAVRLERLPPSTNPLIATTTALEFIRLLEAEVAPTGIAVGAYYEWLTDPTGTYGGRAALSGSFIVGTAMTNQPLTKLSNFWESARRRAHAELRRDAAAQGNGVLAHTQFSQLFKRELENSPDQYLGRHIVIGTVVDLRPGAKVPHEIETVVDARDELSPLKGGGGPSHNAYTSNDREGSI